MAYSDWNIVRTIGSLYSGGLTSQPSISGDPIVGDPSGRKYFYYDSTPWATSFRYGSQTKAHLIDPSYINLTHNNAISLRAKVKVNNFITNNSNNNTLYNLAYSMGLTAYSRQNQPYAGDANYGFGGGYSLCLVRKMTENRNVSPDLYSTELVIKALSNDTNYSYGWYANVVVCTGTYTAEQWYDIRFDVIPLSLTAKNLIAYTSPDDGITWNQVGLYTVNIGQAYLWRNDGYVGYESFLFTNWGEHVINASNNAETFIKDFKINVDPINFIP